MGKRIDVRRLGWLHILYRKTKDTIFFHNLCMKCLVAFCSFKPVDGLSVDFYSSNWQVIQVNSG